MADRAQTKVLAIALDAMDLSLAEHLMEQGRMPNLAGLRSNGAFARSKSSAEWFVASPWPTFYTSTTPADHGIYHYLLWDRHTMSSRRPRPGHRMAEPFWRDLERRGLKTIVIDAPMVFPPPSGDSGIEICGWCTHDTLADSWVHPPSIAERLRDHGLKPIALVEPYHLLSRDEINSIQRQLNLSTSAIRELSATVLSDETWDFGLVSFTAPHMGGHQFWSNTSLTIDAANTGASVAREILEDVYMKCDQAVGRLLDVVPADTTVVVMAIHGIGANTNRGDLLPQMLRMILAEPGAAAGAPVSLLKAIREIVPQRFRQAVKSRLPRNFQDRLTGFWRSAGQDWSKTKAFAFLPDLQGYIRINLIGRERDGIVQPGAEYDALCEQITRGLMQFVDADTNAPVIDRAVRMDSLFPDHAELARLPDIAVNWSRTPCARHREIISPFGDIAWPTPGKNFDGRSGNHKGTGFLMARGPGIGPGTCLPDVDIMDFAPTLYELFGLAPAAHFKGESMLDQLRSSG